MSGSSERLPRFRRKGYTLGLSEQHQHITNRNVVGQPISIVCPAQRVCVASNYANALPYGMRRTADLRRKSCGVSRWSLGLTLDALGMQRLTRPFPHHFGSALPIELERGTSLARIRMADNSRIRDIPTTEPHQPYANGRAYEYVTQANRHGYG